ncbi:MAG: VWA domain-containing protein [Deltaproteobacteria bacterium]|nr:VWA domain-containing protein [Deltaproteobacteria bacterium]
MNNELTAILMILDRSGSMAPLADDTVGGFNAFIQEQKTQPGDAVVTLVLFNHDYEVVYNARPIQQVEPLTAATYHPGGNTALLDAIGRGTYDLGKKLADMDERDRPGKVIVVIMTDGHENASKEYKREPIRKIVEEQTHKYGWSFLFLGANIDAFAEAGAIGVAKASTMNFVADADGVRKSMGVVSASVAAFRAGGSSKLKN